MKQKKFRIPLLAMMMAALLATSVYAADSYQSSNVPIGASSEVVMSGDIEPTLMSVTLPSYVPFTVSRSLAGTNKVISPRITMSNLSGVPVAVNVTYTRVNLNNLPGTTWSSNGDVGSSQIAIGFQPETVENQMPTALSQTQWLADGWQYMNVTNLYAYGNSSVYLVGTLGDQVPEEGTFTVISTLVASKV